MQLGIFSTAYSAAPGLYEESLIDSQGRRRSVKPRLVRGDPENTREFFHVLHGRRPRNKLYLSGVLAFAEPFERVARIEDAILDSFDEMMFGGADPMRFLALVYRHRDKRNVELHWNVIRASAFGTMLLFEVGGGWP
jgi:hypothetical protein